jgi:uncharacterized protein DUF6084
VSTVPEPPVGSNGAPLAAPEPPAPTIPAPEFAVLGAEYVPYAAAPTLRFTLQAVEATAREIYTIALQMQIHVDPVRRTYDVETRELLADLFGAPERWSATTHSFFWTRHEVLVPSFTGETTFELLVPCTVDHELAASRYFTDLPDGEAPLSFHFNGTVFYPSDDGRMQLTPIPWDRSARFGLPVATWKEMMGHHYPHGRWIALHEETLAALRRHRAAHGLPTLDATVAQLLEEAGDE